MIAIVNITRPGADPAGNHLYEIRINRTPVARFRHVRAKGLAECLRAAAAAVEAEDARAMIRALDTMRPSA